MYVYIFKISSQASTCTAPHIRKKLRTKDMLRVMFRFNVRIRVRFRVRVRVE